MLVLQVAAEPAFSNRTEVVELDGLVLDCRNDYQDLFHFNLQHSPKRCLKYMLP